MARLAFKWVWKKNKAAPSGTRIPGHPARSSVTTLTELHHSSVTINCAVEHHTVTLPQQLAVGARHYTQITHTSLHTNHAHCYTFTHAAHKTSAIIRVGLSSSRLQRGKHITGGNSKLTALRPFETFRSHSADDRRKATSCCQATQVAVSEILL